MSPILDPHTLEFFSRSPEQTRRLGMRLGGLLQTGDLIPLIGELGSGKTTLVQGLAAGWGSLDLVSSPTFLLINTYRHPDGRRLFHVDAYRLQHIQEAHHLDLDTLLQAGPMVIEWADRIHEALPPEGLWVHLRWIDEMQRVMQLSARGSRYQKLLDELKQRLYVV